ncbi:MAG: type III pantothenate kinase [Candidatus Aminicenantes bacterium]|nr:type III pantothenate kinase [Candidatus Aminicenantes bacterium]
MAACPEGTALLTVDVGNTTTACAVFKGETIVYRRHVPTPEKWPAGHLRVLLSEAWRTKITAIIVSSVVPPLDGTLAADCKKILGRKPLFIGHRTLTGIKLKIDRPSELGADRIADCLGALKIFPTPLIIIDSGTAITFDLINKKKEYCGGSILPGIGIAIRSLAENTAKLKNITFAVPASPVGTNTVDSIRAGIFFGYVGTLTHLIALYRRVLGSECKVIATGGLIRYFKGRVPGIDRFEPDLLFYGLKSIYDLQPALA